MSLPETAHIAELDRIEKALHGGSGLVLVHGPEPQLAIDLALLALRRLPDGHAVGVVDVTLCQDDLALARAFARAVAATYIGSIPDAAFATGQWRDARDAGLIALAEQTSPRFYAAIAHAEGIDDAPALFELSVDAFARRAAEGPTVIAFLGADELAGSLRKRPRFEATHAQLWMLRGRLQQSIGSDYVLFAGGARTVELISSQDAAFYGWGTEVPLEPLSLDLLQRQLSAAISEQAEHLPAALPAAPTLAFELAAASEGSVLLAEQLLTVMPLIGIVRARGVPGTRERTPTDQAMAVLLDLNAERLRAQTRLVKGLAPSALSVATALAVGERAYSIVAHPSDAARALNAMAENGIAVRRERSRWMLSDPLFAVWLRQPTAGRLGLDRRALDPVPRWALTS